MRYRRGGRRIQIGDRVAFWHWNGRHEGIVIDVGRVLVKVRADSSSRYATEGLRIFTLTSTEISPV